MTGEPPQDDPRSAVRLVGSLALVAVGLGVALLLLGPSRRPPDFTITVRSGSPVPTGVALDAIYTPETRVRVELTPADDAEARPAVRAWLRSGDAARPIGEPLRPAGSAGWVLDVDARALFARAGRYSLHFGLAAEPDLLVELREAHPAVQWLSLKVDYRVPAP